VDIVAVTTDPERDTPEVNAAYSKEAGLYDSWHFVTGPTQEVKKVWADFGVGVHKVDDADAAPAEGKGKGMTDMDDSATKGLAGADLALGKAIGDRFGGGYEVTHTAPFWIIDPKGNIRVVLNADATPENLATDIKALLSGA
jgi:cytochrome oxidase Cu insertion factor (SCO1/SenC/PrrC family)